jgi:hypothetical protein
MTILTFHEAAAFLRVSEPHLRRIVRLTDIPRRQTGPKARVFFVQERLISWWDRASIPTPISVRTDTFKLIRRARHGGRVPLNTMRRSLQPPDTKVLRGKLPLGAEIEQRGSNVPQSPEHLPRSWQE